MLFSTELCAQSCAKGDDGTEMLHVNFFTSVTEWYHLRPLPLPMICIMFHNKIHCRLPLHLQAIRNG